MSAKKWLGITALLPGLGMVFMDQTVLPVALPTIQKEMNASDLALEWTVNVYLLVIAVLVLVGGKLCDRIGHRKAYSIGIFLFGLSSVLCGASLNVAMLIAARALQGVGAALMFPAFTGLIALIVAPHERGRVSGINVSIGSLFMMLGPLIGGYLTEMVSWRWIFWINIPLAILGMVLPRLFLPSCKPGHGKIDGLGFLYFALTSSTLITLLMQGEHWGWTAWETGLLFLIALTSLFLLIRREKKSPHPFLDLSLFKHPTYAAINVSISIVQFILMITVFRAIYFQQILSYSPSQTGLLTFVSTAPVLFLSPLGGYLSDKISPKLPIAIGYLSLIYSCFWLAFFSTPSLSSLIIALIAFGSGVPLIFTPSYSAAMGSIPPTKIGIAFGMIATLRNFFATLGLAFMGLYINRVQTHFVGTAEQSQIAGFSSIHFVLGFILIAAFALAFILHHRKSAHHLPESPAEGWD